MVKLPEEFIRETRQLMGDERFERYLKAFEEEPPVSIRLNPRKSLTPNPSPSREGSSETPQEGWKVEGGEPVPWCEQGWYLPRRPNFTMDPLLHAGCYYVQEASSMFLWHVVTTLNAQHSARLCRFAPLGQRTLNALDLCAAPGGKSTLLRSVLPDDCLLVSNEPIRNRYQVLEENVQKWGYPNHEVTNLYPRDFVKRGMRFSLILCDVPCSGEGMFRKDPATISEWSPKNVERCWQLQREIVSDAWQCLDDGGILIYSTCTFNTKENEENIRWFMEELGAEVLPVDTKPEWNITGSLLEGFDAPVYRFIPSITRGEGLFLCAMRKETHPQPLPEWRGENTKRVTKRGSHGNPSPPSQGGVGGESFVSLSYPQAIAYLRGESLVLPEDTPRGIVEVTFMGYPLGQMKNIGSRANNLYPKAWRIKTTHIPNEYEAILRHS